MHIASSLKVLCCQFFHCLHYNVFLSFTPHIPSCTSSLSPHSYLASSFILDFSGSVQFECNHPTQCANVPVDTVGAHLAADDIIADCHRYCSVVLEGVHTSQCKFTFPDGNRLSLVVLDDEGKILLVCSIVQRNHSILSIQHA